MKFYKKAFHKFRERRGLTFDDIAAALKVSRTAASYWEREDRPEKPRPKRMRALAALLGCSVQDISDLLPEEGGALSGVAIVSGGGVAVGNQFGDRSVVGGDGAVSWEILDRILDNEKLSAEAKIEMLRLLRGK